MGVNADRRAALGEFERCHLQQSFKRTLVALSAALAISLLSFSALWIVVAYSLAFLLGWRVGVLARLDSWRSRLVGLGEGFLVRFVAWDDVRPELTAVVALLSVFFLAVWINAFGLSIEEVDMASLSDGETLKLLQAAYVSASGWDEPWFPLMAAGAVSLGIVSGLIDGLWVGSVQSRTGASFPETIPFGRDWAAWRRERRERRRAYLRGGG